MATTRTSPTGTPGRRVALDGILVALAMIFSYIETFIPFNFGVPGIKLGLANLVVLLGLTFLPAVDVLLVSAVRIVLSSLLFGNVMSLWYSLAGGLLSFLCMWLLTRREGYSIIGISMAGGVMHNVGQIITAAIIVKTIQLTWYLPVLLVAGLVTGLIIGSLAKLLMPRVQKALESFH
ncbi:MAG: Gx transporter family protein [Clostridia bacterium]|nr:Gx transporter family protein [Clostridia bacterium]MBQ8925258.1 Gx transporter family protein [Clostridia bacterium]